MLCNQPTEVELGELETQAEPKTQGDTAGLEGWSGATSLKDSGVARQSKDKGGAGGNGEPSGAEGVAKAPVVRTGWHLTKTELEGRLRWSHWLRALGWSRGIWAPWFCCEQGSLRQMGVVGELNQASGKRGAGVLAGPEKMIGD